MPSSDEAIPCYKAELVARILAEMPTEDVLDHLARLFGILGDPTRLRMIGALASGEELCVCDVANVVGISLSGTSHQLRKLRDLGLVTHRSEGRMTYYQLRGDFLAGMLSQARAEVEARAA